MKLERTHLPLAGLKDRSLIDILGQIDLQLDQLFIPFRLGVRLQDVGVVEGSARMATMDACWLVHQFYAPADGDETMSHALGRVPVGLVNVETPLFKIGRAHV
jgi:hypothetical protein